MAGTESQGAQGPFCPGRCGDSAEGESHGAGAIQQRGADRLR